MYMCLYTLVVFRNDNKRPELNNNINHVPLQFSISTFFMIDCFLHISTSSGKKNN